MKTFSLIIELYRHISYRRDYKEYFTQRGDIKVANFRVSPWPFCLWHFDKIGVSEESTTKMQSDGWKGREKMCGRLRHSLQNFRYERHNGKFTAAVGSESARANSGRIPGGTKFLTSPLVSLFDLLFRHPMETLAVDQIA